MKIALLFPALLLSASAFASASDPQSEQSVSYEFSAEDMRILAQRVVDSLLTSSLPMEPLPRVAWLRLRNATESKSTPIGELMVAVETALIKSKRVLVVSRSSLQAMADENALSMTLQDPTVAAKLSTLAGVDLWLTGTLRTTTNREDGREFSYYNFSVSLTEQATTAKVWADTAEIKKERKLQLIEKSRLKGRVKN